MSKRRVGGSGWAGVYGSFIGLAKATTKGSAGRRADKKKAPKITNASPLAQSAIDLALQSSDAAVVQAARRVRAVQADVDAARQRLQVLTSQLLVLNSSLSKEMARVDAAAAPLPAKFRSKRLKL